MPGEPKNYTLEFREQSVKKAVGSSPPRTIAEVARELGINRTTPGFWVRAYRNKLAGQPLPSDMPDDERVRELSIRGKAGFTSRRDDNYKALFIPRAIEMAVRNLDLPEGAVFHSDRGSNYTSAEFAKVLKNLGITQSAGCTGICYDSAENKRRELIANSLSGKRRDSSRCRGAHHGPSPNPQQTW